MLARLLVACALILPATATPAPAQAPVTARGAWLGGGIGTASARVNCDICASDRNGGLSGYLAGGLRIGPGLHAGAELSGWFDKTENVSQRLILYGASLWWYPRPGGRWFLKGGAGVLQYHAGTDAANDEPLAGTHGIRDIPAYIRQANDQQLLELALLENLQREDLNAMEIALITNA